MEIMFAIVSIALLFNANVVLSSESSYSSESPYYASGSSYSSDSASTSSSESDDASDIGESGSQSVSTSAEDDVESDTPMLQPFPIRIQHHLPFSNVFVPYDVGKRHKIDRSDPYMGYAPTSSNGNRHYIRVSDSFDCDNDVAIFDFVMCYMANFGFSHGWGGVGATPKVVAKKFGKRWIVGLEVINKLIVQHTKCDLIEHMSNPGNATNNRLCSAKEPASGKTRHRNKKKHGSGLMDHDGDDESSEDNSESDELSNSDELGIGRYKRSAKHRKHLKHSKRLKHLKHRKRSKHRKGSHKGRGHIKTLVNFKGGPRSVVDYSSQESTILVQLEGSSNYHIKIVTYGMGPLRLYWSQIGKNERWLRLHCTDCGGWIDIVEDCHHRSVHYGGAPAEDLTEDVRERLPQCEKSNEAFKCDSYKVKFIKDCRKDIAKLVEYEQENGIIPVDDDEGNSGIDDEPPEDEPQEESTTTTTTRAPPVPKKPAAQFGIGDMLMPERPVRKKPN